MFAPRERQTDDDALIVSDVLTGNEARALEVELARGMLHDPLSANVLGRGPDDPLVTACAKLGLRPHGLVL